MTVDSIVTFCIIDICIKNNVNYQIYGIAYNLSFATIQTKEPLSTHFCVHLIMFCIFTSDYEYRLSVYSFPAGFSLPGAVQSVRRDKFSLLFVEMPQAIREQRFVQGMVTFWWCALGGGLVCMVLFIKYPFLLPFVLFV